MSSAFELDGRGVELPDGRASRVVGRPAGRRETGAPAAVARGRGPSPARDGAGGVVARGGTGTADVVVRGGGRGVGGVAPHRGVAASGSRGDGRATGALGSAAGDPLGSALGGMLRGGDATGEPPMNGAIVPEPSVAATASGVGVMLPGDEGANETVRGASGSSAAVVATMPKSLGR